MTNKQKKEITKISQQFTKGLGFPINGSGWVVVDPLSAYLSAIGHENTLSQLMPTDKNPLVLVMEFPSGEKFIPAGEDLKRLHPDAKNWMWI